MVNRTFSGIKEAHEYYKFKGSYQHGTVYDETGVIRSYSNGSSDDVIEEDSIIYWISVERPYIRDAFDRNKKNNKPLRFFKKNKKADHVEDMGLWVVVKTDFNYVKLKRYVDDTKTD